MQEDWRSGRRRSARAAECREHLADGFGRGGRGSALTVEAIYDGALVARRHRCDRRLYVAVVHALRILLDHMAT
jgi:hypothetical protein